MSTGMYYLDYPHLYQLEKLEEGTKARRNYEVKNRIKIDKEKIRYFDDQYKTLGKRPYQQVQEIKRKAEAKGEQEATKRFVQANKRKVKKNPEFYTLDIVLYTYLED